MKRPFDIFFSVLLLILLLPVFIIVLLIVKVESTGPAIFWTRRIGKNNTLFLMPKIRSMYVGTPQVATHLLSGSTSHITRIGSFLRKTSLDEIPQLWSILVGDMSFVGPRPALFNQDDLRELRTKVGVHKLAPGVTGWAQINGRDEIAIERKVELDREYLDKKSFIFDLQIIIKTFFLVILKKDISH